MACNLLRITSYFELGRILEKFNGGILHLRETAGAGSEAWEQMIMTYDGWLHAIEIELVSSFLGSLGIMWAPEGAGEDLWLAFWAI